MMMMMMMMMMVIIIITHIALYSVDIYELASVNKISTSAST